MKTETCQAAVFYEPGRPIVLEEIPLPKPGSGEALIQVDCCTLCGSDLHSIHGRRKVPMPTILGHEILGRVHALPAEDVPCDVDGAAIEVGERVIWSVAASCGSCDRCVVGVPQKCRHLFKYGHESLDAKYALSGGLAGFCHLAPGTPIVKLGETLSDLEACPAGCATATVAAAMRSCSRIEDRSVLIFGAGMLGVTAAAMAKWHKARSVIVCDIDHSRLQRAQQFGATHVVAWNPDSGEFEARIREITGGGGEGVDVVLELSGSADAVEVAPRLLGIGGELILVGSVSPSRSVAIDPERVVRGLLKIHGVHNYAPEDLSQAVRFLTECRSQYPFESLVEQTFALTDINGAVAAATESNACRVAIRPWPVS